MSWHHIALSYLAYLVTVSFARPEFRHVRARVALSAAVIGIPVVLDLAATPGPAWSLVVLPSLALLGGYRVSGLLFVRVDARAENWLVSKIGRAHV